VISCLGSIFQQHGCGDCIDKAGGDGDVLRREPLEVQVDLDSMHTDIGDRATGCHDILASDERDCYAEMKKAAKVRRAPIDCPTRHADD
jgi:hypothetical protein